MEKSYSQNITYCLAENVGPSGLLPEQLAENIEGLNNSFPAIKAACQKGEMAFLSIARQFDDLQDFLPLALEVRESCRDVLILGTGGSSLGGRTLCGLKAESVPLGAVRSYENQPILHFVDNIDPYSFDRLCQRLDFTKTAMIVVSKSGSTAETLSQFMALLPLFQTVLSPHDLSQRVIAITERPTKERQGNPLRCTVERLGLSCFDHDPDIGGRFSVFSIVGLLPALVAGVDVRAFRQGAASVLDAFLSCDDAGDCPAAVGAAVAVGLDQYCGINQTVIMPYEDRLSDFGLWYNQLWAESLGKDGKGSTPIRALGTADQHSQLQLYLEGPANKFFTILHHDSRGKGLRIDSEVEQEERLDYLSCRTLGDLFFVSAEATRDVLASNLRPVRHILLEDISEKTLGAIMMHYMLETVFAASLMKVDPYGQPAVERGKFVARQKLLTMPLGH